MVNKRHFFFFLSCFTIQKLSIISIQLEKRFHYSSSWEILRFVNVPAAKREQPELTRGKSNMKFVVNLNCWVWEKKALWKMAKKRKRCFLGVDRKNKLQTFLEATVWTGQKQSRRNKYPTYLNNVKCQNYILFLGDVVWYAVFCWRNKYRQQTHA